MAFGHSYLDYIIVIVVFMTTINFLSRQSHRILVWLPTFLTIDFFIDFGTQLTPSRFIPFLLGGWLFLRGDLYPDTRHRSTIFLLTLAVFLSTFFALQYGDTFSRSVFRTLHYLSLILVFIFYTKVIRTREMIDLALWGLIVAGAIHGSHAVYQLIAASTGLPFRYIVYGSSGGTSTHWEGFLRVNGFADEPKRLGYILFTGVLATYYVLRHKFRSHMLVPFRRFQTHFRSPTVLVVLIVVCLLTSLMTFSASYFMALLVTAVILVFTAPRRILVLGGGGAMIIVVGALLVPQKINAFIDQASKLIDARSLELQSDLKSEVIYRQEHYAEALVKDDPLLILTGLGMGRYNMVLFDRFGPEAGYSAKGYIKPLNSQIFEVMFDLGIIGLLTLYGLSFLLALKVGKGGDLEFAIHSGLLFVMIQSTMIDTKFYIAILMAISTALISLRGRLGVHPRRTPRLAAH